MDDKFALFYNELQALLTSRQVNATEITEYIQLLESSSMEKDAFIAIVNYCIAQKGADVSSAYILAVAKHFVQGGVLTVEQVEKTLTEKSNGATSKKEESISQEEYLIKLFRKLNPKLKKNIVDIVKGLTTSLDNK